MSLLHLFLLKFSHYKFGMQKPLTDIKYDNKTDKGKNLKSAKVSFLVLPRVNVFIPRFASFLVIRIRKFTGTGVLTFYRREPLKTLMFDRLP